MYIRGHLPCLAQHLLNSVTEIGTADGQSGQGFPKVQIHGHPETAQELSFEFDLKYWL